MRKRRIWTTSPVYYAMAAAMLVMACLSFRVKDRKSVV